MGAFNRFTPEEDYLILRNYWNTERRKEVAKALEDRHTAKSVQFRYFQLLKELNLGSATTYKRMMEAHETGNFQLPFDLEELVNEFHAKRNEKQEAPKRRRTKRPSQEELEVEPKAEAKPEAKPEPKPEPAAPAAPAEAEEEVSYVAFADDQLMQILQQMQASILDIRRRVDEMSHTTTEKALVDLFSFLANAARYKEQIRNLDAILEENRRLREENEALKEKYREKVREFDDIYQRLDEVWGQFMRLTSVKKAMSLEDFLDQMRIIVDKFGNVVGITTREAGLRGGLYNKEAAVR